jgi:hypothetical protein
MMDERGNEMAGSTEQQPAVRRRWRRWLVGLAIVAIVGSGIAGGLVWAVRDAREAARRSYCNGNQVCVGFAVHNYQSAKGTYPPAYVADEQGRPVHSWRLLVMFDFDPPLYGHYDFKQPWHSEDNMAVAKTGPSGMRPYMLYECPSDRTRGPMDTSFVMPVGPGAISDGPRGASRDAISDGMAHTIFAVEMAGSGICWTEPRDLNTGAMGEKIDDYSVPSVRSRHPNVFSAVMADGSSHSISKDIDPGVLKALFTISGGEKASADIDR